MLFYAVCAEERRIKKQAGGAFIRSIGGIKCRVLHFSLIRIELDVRLHGRVTLLVVVLLGALVSSADATPPLLPDPTRTPGDVLTIDPQVICVPGYTKTVRAVPQSVKNQVYRAYGITSHAPREYEVDHLISLELGGSNSIRNLWPQSYVTQPLNAHVKDRLENTLHRLVCSGKLPLEHAQKAIAVDWTQAYVTYLGPLPMATEQSAVQGPTEGACPATTPIKVSKAGIYHLPDDPYYARTKAVACYATPQEAEAAGYRAPKH